MSFHHDLAGFLELEELVYGFTSRLNELVDEEDDEDEDDSRGYGRPCRRHNNLSCPVCKTVHAYVPPGNNGERYSHDARVIYATFPCPICLEDAAGPPMVVLPCGHGLCQDDFRSLGGQTAQEEENAQERPATTTTTTITTTTTTTSVTSTQQLLQRINDTFLDNSSNNTNNTNDTITILNNANATLAAARAAISSGPTNRLGFDLHFNDDDDDDEDNDDDIMHYWQFHDNDEDDDDDDDDSSFLYPYSGSASTSGDDDDDFDDDDDDDDSSYSDLDLEDPDAILWRLRQYHPGNATQAHVFSSASAVVPRTPNVGQWLLVPEILAPNERVNLLYYRECHHQQQPATLQQQQQQPGFLDHHNSSKLRFIQQYPKGTRLIPNGKHGLYVHAPPSLGATPRTSNNRRASDTTRSQQRNNNNNQLWPVYFVKNIKYNTTTNNNNNNNNNNNTSSNSNNNNDSEPTLPWSTRLRQRQRRRQRQVKPFLRYHIHRHAQIVPDGIGGIWALYPEPSLPETVRRPSEATATVPTSSLVSDNNNNNSNDVVSSSTAAAAVTNVSATSAGREQRQQQQRNHYQRDKRDYRLVHYSREVREGRLVGKVLPAYCKIFMDRSGGVYLLQPNNCSNGDHSQPSSFCSLWHVTFDQEPTLLFAGLRRQTTKVMGDACGTSLFILSAGGRLQSILTRVQVDASVTTGTPIRSTTTSFSYDLDIPFDDIKDVVDGPTMNQVFLHCRCRHHQDEVVWKLCRVGPGQAERDGQVTEDAADCPRHCRIISDQEGGVWIWKKPSRHVGRGERSLVHVGAQDDAEQWQSPCVFPPRTQLAGWRS